MAEHCLALSFYDSEADTVTAWAETLYEAYEGGSVFGTAADTDGAVYEREDVSPEALNGHEQDVLEKAEEARTEWDLPRRCPHERYDDSVDRCIFHLDADQRDRLEVTAAELEREFLETVSEPATGYQGNQKVFVRSTVPRLDLTYDLIDSVDNRPIDFRFATIGELDLDHTILNERILFDNSTIDSCSCEDTTFKGGASFSDALVGGEAVSFRNSQFEASARFDDAVFRTGQLRFDDVQFRGEAWFSHAVVELDTGEATRRKRRGGESVDVSFQDVLFGGYTTFQRLAIRAPDDGSDQNAVGVQVYFRRCRATAGEVTFKNASFGDVGDGGLFGSGPSNPLELDKLSFREADFAGVDVNFTAVDVAGDLHLENVDLTDGRSEFNSMTVTGELQFEEADFSGGDIIFNETRISETADFSGTKFAQNDTVSFHDSSFEADLRFEKATVADGDLDCSELSVTGDASFGNARFTGDEVTFEDAQFQRRLVFNNAQFAVHEISFAAVHVDGRADLERAELDCKVVDARRLAFGDEALCERLRILADKATFASAHFGAGAVFRDAEFAGDVSFASATFEGAPIDFAGVDASEATLDFEQVETPAEATPSAGGLVDFSDATVTTGRFVQPDGSRTYYDFTGATVGDVTLRFGDRRDPEETLFEYFRFRETDFEGFDFSDSTYRRDLKANGWRLHTVTDVDEARPRNRPLTDRVSEVTQKYARLVRSGSDPEFEPNVLESTYRKARIGADRNGDAEAASKFFQKEHGYRRRGYGYNAWLRGEDGADDQTFFGRVMQAWFWLTNATLWLTSGYGERPKRVVLASLTLVGFFGLIYQFAWDVLQQTPPDQVTTVTDSLLLSAEMFTAIILDGTVVDNSFIRAISYVEGFVGSLLIAMFVLTITRAIRR